MTLSQLWPLDDAKFGKLAERIRFIAKGQLLVFLRYLEEVEGITVVKKSGGWRNKQEHYENRPPRFYCRYTADFLLYPKFASFLYPLLLSYTFGVSNAEVVCIINIKPNEPWWVPLGITRIKHGGDSYDLFYKEALKESDDITTKAASFNPSGLYAHVLNFIKNFWGFGKKKEPLPRLFAFQALKDVEKFENNLKAALQQQGFQVDFIRTRQWRNCTWVDMLRFWWSTTVVFSQQLEPQKSPNTYSVDIMWEAQYTFSSAGPGGVQRLERVAPLQPKEGYLSLTGTYKMWGGRSFEEMLGAAALSVRFHHLVCNDILFVNRANLTEKLPKSDLDVLRVEVSINWLAKLVASLLKRLVGEAETVRTPETELSAPPTEGFTNKHLYYAAVLCVAIATATMLRGKYFSPRVQWYAFSDRIHFEYNTGYVSIGFTIPAKPRPRYLFFKVSVEKPQSQLVYTLSVSEDLFGNLEWQIDVTKPPKEIVKSAVKQIIEYTRW